jgi:hypothetical protein
MSDGRGGFETLDQKIFGQKKKNRREHSLTVGVLK